MRLMARELGTLWGIEVEGGESKGGARRAAYQNPWP